ncbi:MAG TPA: amidase [Steroidobacteraceae bacterium]|nr:amidase [Steroidobacteraceae bacterium]
MTEDLTWMPAWRIRELIGARELSPVEVAEHFLDRIGQYQDVLRAVEHVVVAQVRSAAKAAEAAVLAGADLPPLHGVPVAVKSHIDIEGLPETMPFGANIAPGDDLMVERLRAAGAVIVGHTNMPVYREDGSFDYERTARNPWDPARTPGISSAGSASAVAAGLLPIALASDGGGSSRLPAAYSGVIGVHSTPGSVPWVNHKRQTQLGSTATIGPMTRDVRDAATLLSVIAGPDGRDEVGLPITLPDPRSELALDAAGLRLAWTDDFGYARKYAVEESERVITHIRSAAFALNRIGATVETTEIEWEDSVEAMRRKFAAEGVASMGLLGGEVAPDDYRTAIGVRHRNWQRFRHLFAEADLLLCPTISSVAPVIEVFATRIPTGKSILDLTPGAAAYTAYTGLFNWLKLPSVSVPCGFVDGLPVGLQIVGPSGSDAKILRLAQAFMLAFPRTEVPPVS